MEKEHTEFVGFTSKARISLIRLTEYIHKFIKKYDIGAGEIVIISPHTTGAIIINENEEGLREDIKGFLAEFIPRSTPDKILWRHDDLDNRVENMCKGEKQNAQAHLMRLFLPRNQTIYIVKGFPILGQWEELFFVELDGPRYRNVVFKITAK